MLYFAINSIFWTCAGEPD